MSARDAVRAREEAKKPKRVVIEAKVTKPRSKPVVVEPEPVDAIADIDLADLPELDDDG